MNNPFLMDTCCVMEYDDLITTKPHILPIYATSSFELESMEHGFDVFTGKQKGHVYGRYGNPTIDTTARKLAELESYGLDTESFGLMTSSGMSAIMVLLQSLLSPGDALVTQEDLYGGTTELLHSVFPKMGIQTYFTNLQDEQKLHSLLENHPEIKVMYLETPSNPLCNCIDLEAMNRICKEFNLISVVDNTFCTPFVQQPFRHGMDYVIHSTTKYLNGHGNSIAGVIIGRDLSKKDIIWKNLKLTGGTCNPFDAWLVYNGLKTLGLRMEKHSENAMALAGFFFHHPGVDKVNYAGLASHPHHDIAKSQMNLFGGMLSFEVKGGVEAVKTVMNSLQLATYAPTLGDVNTLVLHPRSSSHLNVDPVICDRNGITESLIRVSVGIENAKDIIRDFEQALDKI